MKIYQKASGLVRPRPPSIVQMKGGRTQLYLYGDVGTVFGGFGPQDVQEALRGATGPLDIFISSDGGDAFDGVAIHSILSRYPGRKTAHVDGVAASAASVILMAGDERVMGVGSSVMVHGAWSGVMGNAARLREAADKLEGITQSISEIYARRTGRPAETVGAWMESAETWFNADQAVAEGLADRVEDAPVRQAAAEAPRLSQIDTARLLSRARH